MLERVAGAERSESLDGTLRTLVLSVEDPVRFLPLVPGLLVRKPGCKVALLHCSSVDRRSNSSQ